MYTLEEIKKILNENKSENKQKNYDVKLMENKIKFDIKLLEVLLGAYSVKEPTVELEEAVDNLFAAAVKIYEALDLYPYLYRRTEFNDLHTTKEFYKKASQLLQEDLTSIYDECKKNKDEERFNTTCELIRRKLTETGDIKVSLRYAEDYELLSEAIDKIIFPSFNEKILKDIDDYIERNKLDKERIEELFNEYEKAKKELIEVILG